MNSSDHKCFSVGHLNCRSLFTGFNELCLLLKDHSYDILAITETWLNEDTLSDAFVIEGYRLWRKDRQGRGGGVGFYIKNSIQCRVMDFQIDDTGTLEYMWVSPIVNRTSYCVCVIYRPPRSRLDVCINFFDNALPQCLTEFDNIVVLGDLNCNFLENGNPVLECLSTYGFTQVIEEPTRIARNSLSLLDPIFVVVMTEVINAGTVNADNISDHRLTYCNINLPSRGRVSKFVTNRDFKSFNKERFDIDLRNVSWDQIYFFNNIDCKVDFLTENLKKLFDKHAPLRRIRVNKPPAPWLTDNLKVIFRVRDQALAKYKLQRTEIASTEYKQARNCALASLRREKAGYLSFLQRSKDQRKLWNALKDMNIQQNNTAEIPEVLLDPDQLSIQLTAS
nr:unnamed protein product [Callosobruchus analis]